MSGLYYLKVPAGAVGAFHDVSSPKIVDFLGGLPLFLSFDLEAVRASGSATCTVHFELKWYNASGAALTPWTQDIVVNATMAKTLYKYPVIPPTSATSGVCYIRITPAASPMQHTVTISQLRLGKTALAADVTAEVAAIGDANRVRYSQIEKFPPVWGSADNPNGLAFTTTQVLLNGRPYLQMAVGFNANNQVVASGTLAGNNDSFIPVVGGERLFFSARVANDSTVGATGSTRLELGFLNAAGAEIGTRGISQTMTGPTDFTRLGNFASAPAGAVACFFRLITQNNAYGTPHTAYVTATDFMVCSAGPSQTDWPRFSPGPSSEYNATLGAAWGNNLTGRPGNLAALTGLEGVNNSLISIGSNGALAGGSGGQVTLPGLGAGPWAAETRLPSSLYNGAANLVFNGGLRLKDGSNYALGVNRVGVATGGWVLVTAGGNEGNYVYWTGDIPAQAAYNQFEPMQVYQNATYIMQFEGIFLGTRGGVYMQVNWYSDAAATNFISQSPAISLAIASGWQSKAAQVTAPAGAVRAIPYFTLYDVATGSGGIVALRRVKMAADLFGHATAFTDEATTDYQVLTRKGTGVQVGDQRNLPAITAMNLGYKYNATISYTATSTSATISVGAGYGLIGSVSVSYSAMAVGVSGSAGVLRTFFLYLDDPGFAGGTKTLMATTDSNVSFSSDGRVYIGSCVVNFPTSGTGTGTGTPGGGGCVCFGTVLPTHDDAKLVGTAEQLVVVDPVTLEESLGEVTYSEPKYVACVRFKTSRGVELEASRGAPIAVANGEAVLAPDLMGHLIPVKEFGVYGYDTVVEVIDIGLQWVQHITCQNAFFLAGLHRGRFVLHHNVKPTDPNL